MRCIILVTIIVLAGCTAVVDERGRDGDMLVRLGPGDSYTYSFSGPGANILTFIVGEPRPVLDAYGQTVLAAPLLLEDTTPNTLINFLDVRHGGLAIAATACAFVSGMTCVSNALVSWQQCPAMGFLAPFDSIPRDAIGGATLTYIEPTRDLKWTYDVERVGTVARLRLRPESERWEGCPPPVSATIDVPQGVVLDYSRGTRNMHLESYRLTGAAFEILPRTEWPSIPVVASADGLPAGWGQLAPYGWSMGDAWSFAREQPEPRAFLAAHPGAMVAYAEKGGGAGSGPAGIAPNSHARWIFTILSPTGEVIAIKVQRQKAGILPDEYSATPAQPEIQEDYPKGFSEIEPTVSYDDFVSHVAALVGDARLPPIFDLDATPRGAGYSFVYPFGVQSAGGATLASELADYDAGTGRLLQATGSAENLAVFIKPEP